MGKETGFRKGKTFWHYILSNVGLVVLCSTLLFTIMSFSFIRSMERTEREQQLLKMQLAVEDVQKQFELLQYISVQIGSNVIYHPAFYVNNSYYQLNMIRDLEKYSGYSNISNQYFFFYQDDSWAYRSTGKIYLSAALKAAGVQNIQKAEAVLNGQESIAVYQEEGSGILLNFRLKLGSSGTLGNICFVIEKESLCNRVQVVSGMPNLMCSIYLEDAPLLEVEPRREMQRVQAGRFSLVGCAQASDVSKWIETYLYLEAGLIVLFMLGLGILLAYKNWRPIHRIAITLNTENESDELRVLEQAIAEYKNNERIYQAQRVKFKEEQRKTLRRMTRLMLDYPVYANKNDYLQSFEKIASKRFFLPVLFTSVPSVNKAWMEAMEAMSDSTMSVSAFGWQETEYVAMLVNTDDEQIRRHLEALFLELKTLQGMPLDAAYGRLTQRTEEIPDVFCDMMRQLIAQKKVHFPFWQMAAYFDAIKMQSIHRIGQASAELAQDIKKAFPAQCFQKSCLQMWRQSMLEQFPQYAGAETELNDALLYDTIEGLLKKAANQLIVEQDAQDKQVKLILNAIHRQYTQQDCSLDTLSSSLHISSRQITRILKETTGRTFKDYLLEARMKEACRLLQETELPVGDIMEACGYASASQFFKRFSEFTGKTPSAYRKDYWQEQLEKHNLNR